MRPRIALTLSRPSPFQQASHQRYRDALERAGADLLVLHPDDAIPVDIDGLCLSGGGDIAAGRYGEEDVACRDVDRDRDALELAIARGGRLLQDVAGHQPQEREGLVEHREVSPRPGTRLAAACGSAPLTVDSRHHQAVSAATLGQGLVPTACVDDLVEAFEATDRNWVVGVQWHPERTQEVSPEACRILDALVAETARRATPAR